MPELPVDNGDEQAPGEGMRQWGLSIRAVSEDSARVACNFKGVGSVASYQLQGQTVGRDAQGMPAAVWKPFTNSTITVTGPVVTAEMEHLQPGMLYVVRLAAMDAQGRVIASSSGRQVWTVMPTHRIHWGWLVLGGAALAGAGWWWVKRGRFGFRLG